MQTTKSFEGHLKLEYNNNTASMIILYNDRYNESMKKFDVNPTDSFWNTMYLQGSNTQNFNQ